MTAALNKRCTRCDTVKPVSMFHKNARTSSGLYAWCKACVSERSKALYRDPEFAAKEKERQRKRRATDPEHVRAIRRKSYARNRAKHSAAQAAYRAKRVLTPEQLAARKAQQARYRAANPEIIKAARERYRAKTGGKTPFSVRRLPSWLAGKRPEGIPAVDARVNVLEGA